MKKRNITVSLVFVLSIVWLHISVAAAPGDFDLSFGTNGQFFNAISFSNAATDVAIQPDGKIVLASSFFNSSSNFDFAVIRVTANGALDTSFGTGGRVEIPFDLIANEEAVAIAVQSDGKIVVTGYAEFGSPGYDFAVARLNADGSLDTTFDGDGRVKIPVSNSNDFPTDLAIQPDGKIVIVGRGFNQPNADAAIIRLNSDGSLDTSFNGTGKRVLPIGAGAAADNLSEVKIQSDGKIVAAGTDGSDFAVLRFLSNGALDTGFNGSGIVTTPIGTQRDEAFTVAIQSDGKIVAGGSANSGSLDEAALIRLTAGGALDTTFDGDGKTTLDIEQFSSENFKSAVIQTDGKIVGTALGNGKYNIVRYNPNGALDAGFGAGGIRIATVNTGQNGPSKSILQNDGKLIVCGVSSTGGFAVVRFLTAAGRAVFDFDGDSKTDIGIFRPSVGEWWLNRSSTGVTVAAQFGASTDKPVPADFTGDGKADIAFFRPSTGEWFILRSEDLSFLSFPFGTTGDVPLTGDFDGDGKADPTVFRPSTNEWFVSLSGGGTTIATFGVAGDFPVPRDYDGDGKTDIAIYRPSVGEWWINRSSNSTTYAFQFGSATDKVVPGDFTGDGKADAAFFRPSNGFWYILRSEDSSFFSFPFGAAGDLAVPGDYDGDGKTDPGVFRPTENTWYINRTTAGLLIAGFGSTGDAPIPNSVVGP